MLVQWEKQELNLYILIFQFLDGIQMGTLQSKADNVQNLGNLKHTQAVKAFMINKKFTLKYRIIYIMRHKE
jgi:hypothetical protein